MSQRHRTVESILQMINSGYYNESDIYQALADLEAMKDNKMCIRDSPSAWPAGRTRAGVPRPPRS